MGVYSKKPFGGPQKTLDYLGRYTHRAALSNDRIRDVSNGQVTFQWRDYRNKDKYKVAHNFRIEARAGKKRGPRLETVAGCIEIENRSRTPAPSSTA